MALNNWIMKMLKYTIILLTIFCTEVVARNTPEFSNPIFDEAGVLSFTFEKRMNTYLESFSKEVGAKVYLTFVESLDGESIDEYSERTLISMNIAAEEQVILLILSISDRSIKISTSPYDLISDNKIGGIVDSVIPYIKNHQYEKASVFFSDLVIYNVDNTFSLDAPPVTSKNYLNSEGLIFFLVLIFIMFVLGRKFFNERIIFSSHTKVKSKKHITGSWS